MGGPAPLLNGLLPGQLTYFISGDIMDTDNRYLGQDRLYETYMGKLTYKPIPTLTIRLSGMLDTKDRGVFGNLWKQTVYEDQALSEALLDSAGNAVQLGAS